MPNTHRKKEKTTESISQFYGSTKKITTKVDKI